MSDKQPGLFDESWIGEEPCIVDETPVVPRHIPLLPGVQLNEAYPHIQDLTELERIALTCRSCKLREGCQQVVFGEGNPSGNILFVGEGPGKDEDEQGRPFVGRAGQLLDRILEASGFQRSAVYIANVVKCRPPGNRLPQPDEVKQCRNYLEAQIRLMNPAIIVCLGSLASQVIIDPKARITRIRGQWFARQDKKIIATFHPAALLRNESYKRPTWEDFKAIRDAYQALGK